MQYDDNAEKYGYEGEMTPLKCDELKVYHHKLRHNEYAEFCLKYEVDKVIAEKDNEIAELQAENAQLKKETEFMHSNCVWHAGDGCHRLLGEKLVLIDDITELKAKLEDVQASAYADSVDAGMRERRLKRALYKVCANWAHFAVAFFCSYTTKEKWYRMELKCRKKAKEYK